MPKIKNVSPFGDLFVPLLGIDFKHGAIVDVTDAEAETLLAQSDNFKAWGEPAQKAQRRAERKQAKVQDSGEGVAPIDDAKVGDSE